MKRAALPAAVLVLVFCVLAQGQQTPGPTITSISPSQTTAGGPAFTLIVSGTGFVADGVSRVIFNGTQLPLPMSLSSTQITVRVDAALINAPGTVPVQVVNSGKIESNVVDFVINPVPAITPTALPNATVGVPYSQQFVVTGGTAPFTWSISGSLPPGSPPVLLNNAGLLSGTPTTPGSYTFTVLVTDSVGVRASATYTLTVAQPPLTISTASLPAGTVGAPYSFTLDATGGTPPYSNWRVTDGALPSGLTLDANGQISGTPLAAGSGAVQISVTDRAGQTASKRFNWTVNPAELSITTASLPNATVGAAYSQTFVAAGGTPPYTWTAASLPAWLALSTGGVLSGTPTQSGSFTFTVTVIDSASPRATASRQFTVTVNPAALSITTASLPGATAGTAYSQALAATGGTPPYTWTATSLPAWLSLSAGGVLSGTPAQSGSFTFTVTVTDSARPAATASRQFTLTVAVPQAPQVSITGLTDTVNPIQQPAVDVQLSAAYPLAITGTITLAFTPDAVNPSDDPSIQFSTGGRTISFTIPAGQTSASWASTHFIQTGTVAGTITLTLSLSAGGQNITPTPAPTRSVRIARAAPTIQSVQVVRTSSGFNVQVKGYSTPRQVTQAVFNFAAAQGGNLQTTQLTVAVDSVFTTWYTGTSSTQYGSLFLYTQPFTVTGNVSAIASVSVTLSNATGSSSAGPVSVPAN
jgi:hypothetical protein